jgi:hypothetical protein
VAIRPRDSTPAALLALVAANLLPLWGVVAGGWTVWQVLVVYWLESGVVGPLSVDTSGPAEPVDGLHVYAANVPVAAFFCLHYGIFWAVHGAFVLAFPAFVGSFGTLAGTLSTVWVAVAGLVVSHGVSFATNDPGAHLREHREASATGRTPGGRSETAG